MFAADWRWKFFDNGRIMWISVQAGSTRPILDISVNSLVLKWYTDPYSGTNFSLIPPSRKSPLSREKSRNNYKSWHQSREYLSQIQERNFNLQQNRIYHQLRIHLSILSLSSPFLPQKQTTKNPSSSYVLTSTTFFAPSAPNKSTKLTKSLTHPSSCSV